MNKEKIGAFFGGVKADGPKIEVHNVKDTVDTSFGVATVVEKHIVRETGLWKYTVQLRDRCVLEAVVSVCGPALPSILLDNFTEYSHDSACVDPTEETLGLIITPQKHLLWIPLYPSAY